MALHGVHSSSISQQPQDSTGVFADRDLPLVIDHIRGELRRLENQRVAIVRRIAIIKRTMAGLDTVFGPGIIDEELKVLLASRCSLDHSRRSGLTSCCRRLLGSGRSPLTFQEMLTAFREQYPQIFLAQKDPPASLRTVLRRLVTYGEVVQAGSGRGLTWQASSVLPLHKDIAETGSHDGIFRKAGSDTKLPEGEVAV